MEQVTDFILSTNSWYDFKGEVCWALCRFNTLKFRRELFSVLNVERPESLEMATDKRLAEYLAGRYSALLSLNNHNERFNTPQSINISKHRYPIWPAGFIGSISHCNDQAVSITAKSNKLLSVGVDIELYLSAKMSEKVSWKIHNAEEMSILLSAGIDANIATTLLFSAKESIFKAVYPLVKFYFGFMAVRITQINILEQSMLFEPTQEFLKNRAISPYYKCYFDLQGDRVLTYILLWRRDNYN
ncbi:4'-phosphopantetheinyl transferase family protein [Vibrio lentus]|uniref:4'-phosphopantetheinyl transferase family protein n=1 Tax=Vibrio lentus TaxID=136468 RepID=UPI000C83BE8E|nr:4'-phosphopantetheinyl transferase superfamily protein [Vibrio lentus]PMG78023.1 hypothetical protein BCU86_21125 [Vibrio lentus]